MAKGSVSRKQLLKEPDKFITFSGKLIAFGRSNLKAILIGAGVMIALVVVLVTVRQVADRNERRASMLTEKAMAKYSAALQDTDSKTAFDRIKPDFSALFDQYGSRRAVRIARIVYADISYQAGDADTAVAMYKRALDDFEQSSALKNIIVSGLGHAYALKKEYPESIRYFKMISDGQEKTLKGDALFNMACLYEAGGEKEKSTAMFQQLLADFPGSMYEALARERISG
ncbi:hypothetical protein DSCO28_48670 [Desulfosarcina ovata subsp. sediminis]|uniref:Uncharacterized protein n=1 Tax=Desulfosarcina ovata subsp. sediminis TaxID=885957 RepID=A0A5K7ZW17_9BACT|nr:tetratricopeptide repeat protein [Desulfosarcina ovata]BBO84301.1 hypothetical protein DSCO28_48670 [Desulfosarcina ovata subsp. sediminis]